MSEELERAQELYRTTHANLLEANDQNAKLKVALLKARSRVRELEGAMHSIADIPGRLDGTVHISRGIAEAALAPAEKTPGQERETANPNTEGDTQCR